MRPKRNARRKPRELGLVRFDDVAHDRVGDVDGRRALAREALEDSVSPPMRSAAPPREPTVSSKRRPASAAARIA